MYYFYQAYYQENSNGIACAYEIVRILNENGIPARIVNTENEEFCRKYYKPLPDKYAAFYLPKDAVPKELTASDTAVISDTFEEAVPKNANVVRWLMNKPWCLLGKPNDYSSTELVVAYSNYVNNKLPQLFMEKDERELFRGIRDSVERSEDTVSVYFGKVHPDVLHEKAGLLKSIIGNYRKVNVITRSYPGNREKTLRLLAQSDLLISFDPLSNTNREACLLGTPALLMDDSFGIRNNRFNVDDSGYLFDYSELAAARERVRDVFRHYCEWQEIQPGAIVDFFAQLSEKLEKIRCNEEARAANAEWNRQLKIYDREEYLHNFNAAPFVSINSMEELPPETAGILGVRISRKKRYIKAARKKTVALLRAAGMLEQARKVYSVLKRRR